MIGCFGPEFVTLYVICSTIVSQDQSHFIPNRWVDARSLIGLICPFLQRLRTRAAPCRALSCVFQLQGAKLRTDRFSLLLIS